MLKLAPPQRDPYWLDLVPGARIKVRPISVAAIIAARHAAAEAMKATEAPKAAEAEAIKTQDAMKSPDSDAVYVGSAAFTRSLARWGILAWEGVGDAAGAPVAPTPGTIDALLEVWQAFDAIDRLYVAPALLGEQEKNV
jgi:hypothetical protein